VEYEKSHVFSRSAQALTSFLFSSSVLHVWILSKAYDLRPLLLLSKYTFAFSKIAYATYESKSRRGFCTAILLLRRPVMLAFDNIALNKCTSSAFALVCAREYYDVLLRANAMKG
jgi:hypothetical protein